MTHFSDITRIPKQKLFMILTTTSVSIPGDERSRTAPGHGYPEHILNYPDIQYFTDEDEWKAAIRELAVPSRFRVAKEFRAFIVEPIEVTTEIRLEMQS